MTLEHAVVIKRLNDELPQWGLSNDNSSIRRTYLTSSWKSSMMIANAIGYLAEANWHHPEMTIEYSAVKINLTTHSDGGVTEKVLALAKCIEVLVECQTDNAILQSPPVRYAMLKPDE